MTHAFRPGRWTLVLVAAAATLPVGRTPAADDKAPEVRNAVLVGEKENGKTVTLGAREHLLVALEFKAGTGYHWKLKEPGKELRLVHQYIIKPFSAQPIGGTRMASFDFAPNGSGTCDLEFDLLAPGGAADRTFKITVMLK